jgi:KipI family sensor histidine kinase inhibitor
VKVLPYGERAVLAEIDDVAQVPVVRAAMAAVPAVIDAIAGAQTVLVVFDPMRTDAARVTAALEAGDFALGGSAGAARSVELPVHYDGDDLAEVADETGLSIGEVVARHSAADYVVRFCGFSPGFAYLDGLDTQLHVPRRSSPRTAVPAGSVAIAGEFTGVYPRSSPGGWRLLGRTDAELWDVRQDPPALLAPGTRVRFVRT